MVLLILVSWLLLSSSLALLPAYMVGRRPGSWLARMWMKRDVGYITREEYEHRALWIVASLLPVAGVCALFGHGLVLGTVWLAGRTPNVFMLAQTAGEKHAQKSLPVAKTVPQLKE